MVQRRNEGSLVHFKVLSWEVGGYLWCWHWGLYVESLQHEPLEKKKVPFTLTEGFCVAWWWVPWSLWTVWLGQSSFPKEKPLGTRYAETVSPDPLESCVPAHSSIPVTFWKLSNLGICLIAGKEERVGKAKRSLGIAGWGKKMDGGQGKVWSLPGLGKKRRFGNGPLETALYSKQFGIFNKCSAHQKRPPKERW